MVKSTGWPHQKVPIFLFKFKVRASLMENPIDLLRSNNIEQWFPTPVFRGAPVFRKHFKGVPQTFQRCSANTSKVFRGFSRKSEVYDRIRTAEYQKIKIIKFS